MGRTLKEAKERKLQQRRDHMQGMIDAAIRYEVEKKKSTDYYKVLKSEVHLREALAILGGDEENINATMYMLENHDTDDCARYIDICKKVANAAYNRLIFIGEIDPDRIWNITGKGYSDEVDVTIGAYGYSGPKTYTVNENSEWIRTN